VTLAAATAACSLVVTLDDLRSDAGTSDAASDGASDAASGDGSWCSRNAPDANFCEDFDEHAVTPSQSLGSSAYAQEDAHATSAPLAARTSLFVDAGGKTLVWLATDSNSSNPATYTVAFDLFLEVAGSVDKPQLIQLTFSTDAGSSEIDVNATATALSVNEIGSGNGASICNNAIALDAWRHVTLTIDFPSKMLTMSTQGNNCVTRSLVANAPLGSPMLLYGIYTTSVIESWQWDFDNVVVTSQ